MLVVFLVARDAVMRRVTIGGRQVAALTRHRHVQADQRKPRQSMVKFDFGIPCRFVVTTLAGLAFLSLVHILLLVTRIAGGRDLLREDAAGVARFAGHARMRPSQRKIRRGIVVKG